MEKFIFQNSTKIIFGKGLVEKSLGSEVRKFSDSVLLVYGGRSCKLNGSYKDVTSSLIEHSVHFEELQGVEANPHISTVRKGVAICKDKGLKAIVALGGGSVIDCAKIIAAGALSNTDPWEFVSHKEPIESALPLITVLTLAATGSEMNSGAVITNEETGEKYGVGRDSLLPKVSFENPEYTFSVSKYQTACGAFDILSHIMEQYFGDVKGSYVQDRMAEGLMETVIHFAPICLEKPDNYEARSQIMWASSLALNDLLSAGHSYPWEVHPIEHPLSGFFNITHGHGLACLTPSYYRYVLNAKNAKRFKEFATNVFHIDSSLPEMEASLKGIVALEDFIKSMGLTLHLKELGVDKDSFRKCAEQALGENKYLGEFARLSEDDIVNIYNKAY